MSHALTLNSIQGKIHRLPNRPPFMLTKDLADIYEADPRQIAQSVRRNPDRFPEDFCFELTKEEKSRLQNEAYLSKQAPNKVIAFTRNGANMLSAILKTPVAAARSVQIMRAFSRLEEQAAPAAAAPAPETVTLSLAEFAQLQSEINGLLKDKIKLLELEKTTQPRRRNFTEAEKRSILAQARNGRGPTEIARALGRSEAAVRGFIASHRGRDA